MTVVLLTGAALTVPAAALADAPPLARVVSRYETASGNTVSRDCGYSAPLPAATGPWTAGAESVRPGCATCSSPATTPTTPM